MSFVIGQTVKCVRDNIGEGAAVVGRTGTIVYVNHDQADEIWVDFKGFDESWVCEPDELEVVA